MAEREIPPLAQSDLDEIAEIPESAYPTVLADIRHRAYSWDSEKFFRFDALFLLMLLDRKLPELTDEMEAELRKIYHAPPPRREPGDPYSYHQGLRAVYDHIREGKLHG